MEQPDLGESGDQYPSSILRLIRKVRARLFVELGVLATKEDNAKVRDSCCSGGPSRSRSVLVSSASRSRGVNEHHYDDYDNGHDHDGGDTDERVCSHAVWRASVCGVDCA